MTRCARRRRFGKEFEALESRFAVEIDDALLSRREIIEAEQETVSKEEAAGFLARIRKAIEE
jgi:hypothetical protein